MKMTLALLVALAFVFACAAPAMAYDMERPVKKIADGTADVIQSPLHLVEKPVDGLKDHDYPLVGFMKGLLKGPFHTIKKAGGGVVDIATFPIK